MASAPDDLLIYSDWIADFLATSLPRVAPRTDQGSLLAAKELDPSPNIPDRTFATVNAARPADSGRGRLQSVPRANLLASWPAPSISPWAPGQLNDEPERAYLERANDLPAGGNVLLLGAGDGLFFRSEGDHKKHWVPLSEVRTLSLTRPLSLIAPPTEPDMLRRSYRLEYTNGTVKEGESAGSVRIDSMLFLYPPTRESAVTRLFIPTSQIRSFNWIETIRQPLPLSLNDVELSPALQTPREKPITSISALLETLDALARHPVRRLGEVLVELGHLSSQQLKHALDRQRVERRRFGKRVPLGEVLLQMGVVTPEKLKVVLLQKLGILRVKLSGLTPDPEALRLVPRTHCRRYRVVPLCLDTQGRLVVAMDNPMSSEALDAVRFTAGRQIVAVLANGRDIDAMLESGDVWTPDAPLQSDRLLATAQVVHGCVPNSIEFDLTGLDELTSQLALETPVAADREPPDLVRESDSTLVRLVNRVIVDAMESGASDIHFDSASGARPSKIRMRRDGVLADYAEVPARFRSAFVSRIKIMANLDIAEHRKHQDGKIDFSRFGPAKLELRVAIIPTVNGLESVILRLLSSATPVPLDRLCLEPSLLAQLLQVMEKPHGLILVCGPTGSGKTTTLHSLISTINTPERKIWTAEDPVEITQEGLSQVQVNAKIGWSFAEALRSLLRADPDVVMIGEIRDRETAQTAVEASLTGHLVLSTLHTNSAPETVARLLDLGVEPYSLGDSLLGVLAQRLARRLCPVCSKSVELENEEVERFARYYAEGTTLEPASVVEDWRKRLGRNGRLYKSHGKGCSYCAGSGYKGRLGIYEFMHVTASLRKLIHQRSEAQAFRDRAVIEGMRMLRQDGIEKVLMGLTSLQLVRAACG